MRRWFATRLSMAHPVLALTLFVAACSGPAVQTATAQGEHALGQLDRSMRTLSETTEP